MTPPFEHATAGRATSPLTPEIRSALEAFRHAKPMCSRCKWKRAEYLMTCDGKPEPRCGDCRETERLHRDRAALANLR